MTYTTRSRMMQATIDSDDAAETVELEERSASAARCGRE
jgi:hypothetical protein